MFLLNVVSVLKAPSQRTFTIQNVSIKLKNKSIFGQEIFNLQYKMFLLNLQEYYITILNINIYNTKCFY